MNERTTKRWGAVVTGRTADWERQPTPVAQGATQKTRQPKLTGVLTRYAVPLWFVAMSAQIVAMRWWLGPYLFGIDARIYYRGAQAWLAGGDPWAAGVTIDGATYHYAGLPPTVILTAPFTLLPESVVVVLWTVMAAGALLWALRRSGFPLTYMAFPPIVHAVMTGNPQAFLVMLVFVAPAVAPLVKVYAVFPMLAERKWRGLALAGALTVGTVALAPSLWFDYLARSGEIGARLFTEASGGWSSPILGAVAIALLFLVDRRAAGWLAPVVAWPAAQFHYGTFAIPLRSVWLLVLLAVPVRGWPVVAVTAYALTLIYQRWRAGTASGSPRSASPCS